MQYVRWNVNISYLNNVRIYVSSVVLLSYSWSMITFSSLGATGIKLTLEKETLFVFADKKDATDGSLVLLDQPEERPTDGTVSWPGEYDLRNIAIRAIGHADGAHISYALEFSGVRLGFLCSPLHDMNDYELEIFGDIDILFIPTDDPKIVQKLVDEIDPRILCPLPTGGDDKFAEVLKIVGAQGVEPVAEYKQKGGLPAEGREIVLLKS